jgi:hypothetical protein
MVSTLRAKTFGLDWKGAALWFYDRASGVGYHSRAVTTPHDGNEGVTRFRGHSVSEGFGLIM